MQPPLPKVLFMPDFWKRFRRDRLAVMGFAVIIMLVAVALLRR
jgi:hypothetical protein